MGIWAGNSEGDEGRKTQKEEGECGGGDGSDLPAEGGGRAESD